MCSGGGERSDFVAYLSDVPQASVIDPVLFLAYIYDHPNGNVITEMWRKHDRSFSTRKHDGNESRPWKTRSPCFRRAET